MIKFARALMTEGCSINSDRERGFSIAANGTWNLYSDGIVRQSDSAEVKNVEIRVHCPSWIERADFDWMKKHKGYPKERWQMGLRFDGEKVKRWPIRCSSGKHTIELVAERFRPPDKDTIELLNYPLPLKKFDVTVTAGETKDIYLSLFHDFSPPVELSDAGVNPRLFQDRRGRIWAFWEEDASPEVSQIYFSFSDDQGNTWNQPEKTSISSDYHDWNASFTQDEGGTYWLVWMSNRDRENMNAVYISKSWDGVTWSFPRRVHTTRYERLKRPGGWTGLDLLINRSGTFLLMVENLCLISSDGIEWKKHGVGKLLRNSPRIIQMRNGHYVEIDGGFISTSKDAISWSEEKRILKSSGFCPYEGGILEDKQGRIIAFSGEWYATSVDGKTWTEPVRPLNWGYIRWARSKLFACSLIQTQDGQFLILWSRKYGDPRASGGVYFSKGTYLRDPTDVLRELKIHENSSLKRSGN